MYTGVFIFIHAAVLVLQLYLCFRVKRLVLRLLPAAAFALTAAVSGVMCMIITGWDVFSWLIFFVFSLILLGVCGLAWGVWTAVYLVKRRKSCG